VLHLQGYYVPILFWLTVRLLRRYVRTVVLTSHNAFLRSDPARGGRLARWGVRHLIADADVVVTHASNDVEQMRSSGLGVPRRFKLIPLGWHPVMPADREGARLALGMRKDDFVVLLLGFIRSDKGLDLVADAAAALDPDVRRMVKIVVAGEDQGGLAPFLERVRKHGLQGGVDVRAGYQTLAEMSRFLVAADVAVLAHRQASGSGVLRMAMAAGTPVIAAQLEAFDDVQRAKSGWVFAPGDSQQLRKALERAIATPDHERRAMGLSGFMFADQRYRWDRIAAEYRDAYLLGMAREKCASPS